MIEQSLQNNRFEYVPAVEARPELEEFYQALMQVNPKLLGGATPECRILRGGDDGYGVVVDPPWLSLKVVLNEEGDFNPMTMQFQGSLHRLRRLC